MDRHKEIIRITAQKHPQNDGKVTELRLLKLYRAAKHTKAGLESELEASDNIHIKATENEALALDLDAGLFAKIDKNDCLSLGVLWVIEAKDSNNQISSKLF